MNNDSSCNVQAPSPTSRVSPHGRNGIRTLFETDYFVALIVVELFVRLTYLIKKEDLKV